MKKVVSGDKIFVETCKMYLSSLSARACQYGYLNVAPGRIILSNSTSIPKEHGDRIMDFGIGELGLHFLYFKDKEFLIKLKEFLKIPSDKCYCLLVSNLVLILNKIKFDKLESFITEKGYHVLTAQGATDFTGKDIVAFPIYNFHIEKNLFDYWNYVQTIGNEEHRAEFPFCEFDLPVDPNIVKRIYFYSFDLKDFAKSNGEKILTESQPMRMMAIDGISNPSLQEFVKKLSEPYTIKCYLWALSNSYVLSVIKFDNAVAQVISYRPNLLALRLPKSTIIETRESLTGMMENINE